MARRIRNLVLVLGDQLDHRSAAFDGFDPARDIVSMAEVAAESERVPSHKARIALFLAAMRHFRDELRASGHPVRYRALDDPANAGSLDGELAATLAELAPGRVVVVEAGEWGVARAIEDACARAGVPLEVRPDRHFLASREDFERHAAGRRQLRLEYFYREMRRRHGILVEGGEPVGGAWNFDADNRGSFGAKGPPAFAEPVGFPPDGTTRAVLALVEDRFAGHPGRLESFDWPVTRAQARVALDDFVEHRLADFGRWQDAMWTDTGGPRAATAPRRQSFLFHSRLSAALNLKLLDPREVIAAAVDAWREGRAPIASVEGFVRQILGWREYVRGIYHRFMPGYADSNALGAQAPLPSLYWTGNTEMRCLAEVVGQTLEHGYAHHIQRLMVTGLFALLLGVRPREVHEWYLAMYVDAVEWVELPNTIGMSQFADGGVMASKPYAATGKYVQRMSNYCAGCRHDPADATGPDACPFTTLYWDFLARNEARLRPNQRMAMQLRNLDRFDDARRRAIGRRAAALRASLGGA